MPENNEKATAEKIVPEKVVPEKAPQRYSVERLAADCKVLFGVSRNTYAGATAKLAGKYTIDEMKEHIHGWLEQKI